MGGFELKELRSYQPGDEKQIMELFQICFGKSLSPAYWIWRFSENPEGKMMIMLQWDSEKLVGHYAVSPIRMTVEGDEILTALSMTTMTHPDYAGKGIFTELAEALYYEEKKKNQLAAVWGFPNNNSHYGFIKNLQWQNLEQIPVFSIETDRIKDVPEDISIGNSFSEKHIASASSNNFMVAIKRDAAYLNWRYRDNPTNKYLLFEGTFGGLTSYAVAKMFTSFSDQSKTEIDIVEWETPSDISIQQQFLSAIKKHFFSASLSRMNMWLPLNDPRHIQLEKFGFRNLGPITYSGIRLLDPAMKAMQVSNNWHYNLGYSDIY